MERSDANVSRVDWELLDTIHAEEVQRQSPLLAFLMLVFLVGVSGNLLVCYVYRTRRKLSSSRRYICLLAAVDTVACLVVVPFAIIDKFIQFDKTNIWVCQAGTFFSSWSLMCQGGVLVVVAVDRYRRICAPLKWQLRLLPTKVSCLVFIVLSLALCVPVPMVYDIQPVLHNDCNITAYVCSFQHNESGPWTFYYLMFCLMLFVAALITICVVYCCIGVVIWRQVLKARVRSLRREVSNLPEDTPTRDNQTSDVKNSRKATFIMFLVSLTFVLSYLPLLSLLLVRSLHPGIEAAMSDSERTAYKFFLHSMFINNAVNPMIYGVSDSGFRSDCKAVVQGCYRRIFRR